MRDREEVVMLDRERKSLVWTIRKSLFSLSCDEPFQIAKSVGPVPDRDQSMLEVGDNVDFVKQNHAKP